MKHRALVTGGLGFIGSHLVDLLVSRGVEVTVVDNVTTGRIENANPQAKLIKKDIFDVDASVFQDQHFVFHCAAWPKIQPSFDLPQEHERVNVMATIDLMTKLKGSKNLRKIVVSSSAAVYGNPVDVPTSEEAPVKPLNPYGLQKYATEQYTLILGRRYNLPAVALRYFNVYGPRGFNPNQSDYSYASVVSLFIHLTLTGKKLTITGDGHQSRDFVHVSDVAHANFLAADSPVEQQIYNVGSGRAISVLELAKLFPAEYTFLPKREGESVHSCANIRKIRQELRWSPQITLEEGIRRELTHAAVS